MKRRRPNLPPVRFFEHQPVYPDHPDDKPDDQHGADQDDQVGGEKAQDEIKRII